KNGFTISKNLRSSQTIQSKNQKIKYKFKMCVRFVAIIKLGDRVKNNTEISRTTKGIKGKYQSETDRELKGKVVGSST
ncbi:hypothetical protein ACV3QP_14325, partial [Clostridium perfringens]